MYKYFVNGNITNVIKKVYYKINNIIIYTYINNSS